MSYAYRIILFSCFYMSTLVINACTDKEPKFNLERIKSMNNHANSLQKSNTQNNHYQARDKSGTSVLLEWKQTSLLSLDFAESMKSVWDIARQAYTPIEMQFLKAFPDTATNESYFKPFESLFQNGIEKVDWKAAEQIMETILKSHFIFDASLFNEAIKNKFAQDTCFFASITDNATKKFIGFITFLIRSEYQLGDVKVMSFAVDPAHQNRGLGKLLISSIFKIAPEIKRIFLCTRVSNNNALRTYQSWGFVEDLNPILDHPFNMNHWSFLEYKTERSSILQKVAQAITIK